MGVKKALFHLVNHIEEYVCGLLLSAFVSLLFVQILMRQFFAYSIPWAEEVATYMFVWFAYLGAVVAAKMSAHNRVTFQFKPFPPIVKKVSETVADLIWVAFNVYFTWLSYDFVFNRMNLFWKSQTTGVPMKYFFMVLPLAFGLMSLRILWNNYLIWFRAVEMVDPESQELAQIQKKSRALKKQLKGA